MDVTKMQSGFRVNAVILVDSSLHRESHIEFGKNVKTDMDISTNVSVNDQQITVIESVVVKQYFASKEQVRISVKMAGMFECVGDTQIPDYKEFGRVNAAAIIFPYIREHISSLSLKAGLAPLILPPINFAKQQAEKE